MYPLSWKWHPKHALILISFLPILLRCNLPCIRTTFYLPVMDTGSILLFRQRMSDCNNCRFSVLLLSGSFFSPLISVSHSLFWFEVCAEFYTSAIPILLCKFSYILATVTIGGHPHSFKVFTIPAVRFHSSFLSAT